jgi:hypothetical protein
MTPASFGGSLMALLTALLAVTPMSGQVQTGAPADIAILVQADVLRGTAGVARVPIVVGADVPQAANVTVRVRGTAADGVQKVVGEATGSGGPGPLRVTHEFSLPPGAYDVEAALTYANGGQAVAAPATSRVVVPDVWGSALAVTPIVLGETVTAAPRRAGILPFNFGQTAMAPAVSSRFSQGGVVNVAFRIFNSELDRAGKPDLTVEYFFYQQNSKRLNFFNKIKPQRLAADTIGDWFDPQAGVVTAGMMIPLGSFPFGEFQLRVHVTDNRNKQSDEREVRFFVAP